MERISCLMDEKEGRCMEQWLRAQPKGFGVRFRGGRGGQWEGIIPMGPLPLSEVLHKQSLKSEDGEEYSNRRSSNSLSRDSSRSSSPLSENAYRADSVTELRTCL